MKFASLAFAVFGFLFATMPIVTAVVTAENQLRMVFSTGGNETGVSCSSKDMHQIEKRFKMDKRYLRQDDSDMSDHDMDHTDIVSDHGRKLPATFYPPSCRNSCAGVATGRCLVPGCKGFRRELGSEIANDRNLQQAAWCVEAISLANETLIRLARTALITTPCKSLLSGPTSFECLYNVVC
jgi:hypothetical protein